MALTLNEKCLTLLDTFEKYITREQKSLPILMRSVVKPMCTTIRSLLIIQPEEKLQKHLENLNIMNEALQATYETKDEFSKAMEELFHLWN